MTLSPHRLRAYSLALCAGAMLAPAAVSAGSASFTPSLGTELRYFPEDPAFAGQLSGVQSSLVLSGDGRWVSDDRKQRVRFEPFLRLDGRDGERTHFDIRELSYTRRFDNGTDVLAGVGQIFWGVAESRNVVDVINQFDVVENSDETDKLGQPMLRLGKFFDFGRIEAYYLPYFRERTFPGVNGRQRFALPFDTDNAEYERDGEEFAGDFALRYTHQIDAFDIGLSAFHGTNRNPFFKPSANGTRITPVYQRLTQSGLDVQWTEDAWLLKFELIGARSGGDNFMAGVMGYEYTFFGITDSGMDLGILTEYLHDNRDSTRTAASIFENDIFVGARLSWNDIADSELLGGAIVDVETGATFGSVEYATRIADNYKLELEGQYLTAPGRDPVNSFDQDSNLIMRLTRYF